MALCRGCRRIMPCHCHLGPPPKKAGPNVYIVEERYPANMPNRDRDAVTAQQDETCANCRGTGLDPRYNGEFACPDCMTAVDARQDGACPPGCIACATDESHDPTWARQDGAPS